MKNYFEEICIKLNNKIEIEHIDIVDNSHKHKKHKSFSPEKFHLHLKIRSLYLNSISRVNAQKMIMKVSTLSISPLETIYQPINP